MKNVTSINVVQHPYDVDLRILYNGKGFRKFEVLRPITCTLSDGTWFIIPEGAQVDGRSSPTGLKWAFPTFNKATRAWLAHDYMYRIGWGTQKQADKEMYFLSRVLNPGKWYQWPYWDSLLSFWFVRIFGGKVYNRNVT